MAVNVVLTRKFFDADLQFIKNGVKEGANIIIPEAFTEDDLMKYAPEADIADASANSVMPSVS